MDIAVYTVLSIWAVWIIAAIWVSLCYNSRNNRIIMDRIFLFIFVSSIVAMLSLAVHGIFAPDPPKTEVAP